MRKVDPKTVPQLQIRHRDWQLFAGEYLRECLGRTFWFRDKKYRIDGWIYRNPVTTIYVIRESDGVPFVMSRAELDETDWVHDPTPTKRRRK